jgi:GTP cyclohydrolase I
MAVTLGDLLRPEAAIASHIREILQLVGEDPNREGLRETPARVARSYQELFRGYSADPESLLKTFECEESSDSGLVLLKDIDVYSMCEHHMLPFVGRAHVAYIPRGRVLGVSKLARLVDHFARRLQIQERLGEQVVKWLMDKLVPEGAACIIEAEHLCMRMRGCSQQHSTMVTSALGGSFLSQPETRAELMQLINRK